MRDQTAREPKFPAACARCGGRISEPVTFCPHCGAHARFALAGNALHAGAAGHAPHASSQHPGTAASARAEPQVPHYDFEGDLDPPWPGPPTPLFASPDGDPYGEVHAPGFRGERQWGLKAGTVLVVAAFVVLYGGAVAVHRFDGASPLSQPSSSKSADGAIAANGAAESNFAAPLNGNTARDGSVTSRNASQQPAVDSTTASNGSDSNSTNSNRADLNSAEANTAMRNVAPPAANATDSRQSDRTTIAALPPPSAPVQAAPDTASPQAQPEAQPQTQPQAQQSQPQTQSTNAQDTRAAVRSRHYTQSAEAPSSLGDTATAGTQAGRQLRRAPSQREAGQYGRAAAARALDNAQVQLAKSDLRGARASLARALASDPNNSEALSLRDQLVSREQERDASLSAAHACVVQSRWNCVWHNAGKALSVDASSAEARALVDRAIVESGAATAPAGPGPDNVQVPMLQ